MQNKVSGEIFFSAFSEERVLMNQKLTPVVAGILNQIHKTEFSERFWAIIVAPYISAIVSSRLIMENDKLKICKPLDVFANTIVPNLHSQVYGTLRYTIKSVRSLGRFKNISEHLAKYNNIAVGFHYKGSILSRVDCFLDAYYPFLIKKLFYRKTNRKYIPFSRESDFSISFIHNITEHFPKAYLELFDSIYKKIPLFNPEKKIFHVSFYENTFIRVLIAKYVEHGAKLYHYQHGGFYGEYEHLSAHHYESGVSDKFLTWGWKMLPKDMPSCAFRLEKFSQMYQKKENVACDLLMVFPAITNRNNAKILDNSKGILLKINRKKFPIIYVRPRPISKVNRRAELKCLKNHVTKIDEGYQNICHVISDSKLVLQMTYPSTNTMECFYVNHPTVAILENHQPSSIVKPYYEFLLERGVFHYSIETLVDHLNRVNIDEWWHDLIKHPMYLSFKNTFLREVLV